MTFFFSLFFGVSTWVMVMYGTRVWIEHYEQLLLRQDTIALDVKRATVPYHARPRSLY
jgi:hypothetical protein